ncbi:MAG TPA: SAM-dependent methyltransferase [Saprospiraceae bacterium]|nr:SAM-dependent methyltransferase [Saprospiraceae bacterium]
MSKGSLHLIPVPLSGGGLDSLSPSALEACRRLDAFVVERAKTARAFLKTVGHPKGISGIEIWEIPQKDTAAFFSERILQLSQGQSLGLLSEAGLPCVADPGYEFVLAAQQKTVAVYPYPGPNSMMLALMASGLNGQEFRFHGYLPAKKEALRDKLIHICNEIKRTGVTQLFMETPYRNKQVFDMVKHNVPADLLLCIASGLTAPEQRVITKKVKEWTEDEMKRHLDIPSVFVLGR